METILTSLSIGLLATTSPCVLPLYPGFLAYISGGQESLQGKAGRYFHCRRDHHCFWNHAVIQR
jgi:cytochrome c biogenesis protein CcdA